MDLWLGLSCLFLVNTWRRVSLIHNKFVVGTILEDRLWLIDLRSDIVGDLKITVGASTLSVDNSLGDSLTGEVSKLVEEVEVLSEDGATGASGHRVLVVVDGGAGAGRDDVFHSVFDFDLILKL